MTARNGADEASMPSMQADDKPRRPIRWMQRTRELVRAIVRASSAVPSRESSSTKMTSQAMPSRAASRSRTNSPILWRSLKVGTTTDRSAAAAIGLSMRIVLDLFVGRSAPRATVAAQRRVFAGLRSAEQRLDLGAQSRRDIVPCQRIGDVGGEEADLAAAIEAAAFEFEPIERLRLRQANHGVGQLNFAARTTSLGRQYVEDFRLQDIAPGDDQIRRCVVARRLLDHAGDLEGRPFGLSHPDDAVHMDAVHGHLFHGDDICRARQLLIDVQHLGHATAPRLDQDIRQQQRKRFMADDVAGTPDRVAEPERLLLAGEAGLTGTG